MKFLFVSLAVALFCASPQSQSHAQLRPVRHSPKAVTLSVRTNLIHSSFIPEGQPRTKTLRIGDVDLEAAFKHRDDSGATFWFVRERKTIYSFTAKDLLADGIWIAVGHDPNAARSSGVNNIALTYSTGGAIGNFRVRVFHLDRDVVTDVSKAITDAVDDFKSRHYCNERGNNVTALKWLEGDLLLMTEVYPTSDCGSDLGHVEAYRVTVPSGKIQEHLTLEQLKLYPGVCLENYDEKQN